MKLSSFTAHTYTYIYVLCSLLIDPLTKALSARSILFCEVNTGNGGYLRSLERHGWSCGLNNSTLCCTLPVETMAKEGQEASALVV